MRGKEKWYSWRTAVLKGSHDKETISILKTGSIVRWIRDLEANPLFPNTDSSNNSAKLPKFSVFQNIFHEMEYLNTPLNVDLD